MLRLPKGFHPDFSVPGRKPVSSIEIDCNNAIARKLSALCDFATVEDFAREKISLINGTLHASAPGWGVNRTGRMWESSGSGFTPWGITFDSTKTNKFLGANGEAGFNIVIIGKFNSRGGSTTLANLVGDDGDDGLTINADGTVSWVSGSARLTTTNSISSGDSFVIVAGYKYNDSNTYINLNGVTTTGNPGGFSINGRLEYICGRSGQNVCSAEINTFYVIDGLLNTTQAEQLQKNPYQIFKPSSDLYLFVPSGGATYTLIPETGTLSITGGNIATLHNKSLAPETGSLTTAGGNVSLLYNRVIAPETGSITASGNAINVLHNKKLTPETGTFSLTGSPITLTYTPGGATYTLTLETGVLTATGGNVSLLHNKSLTPATGTLGVTGDSVSLLYNRVLSPSTGALTLSGSAINLYANRQIVPGTGTLNVTGSSITLTYSSAVVPNTPDSRTLSINAYTRTLNANTRIRFIVADEQNRNL